ncbi:hypothetical protein IH980_03655 [Patescibacteria group bacterium]|nr:hypothetical protein [Patescibacteria group bacterium]
MKKKRKLPEFNHYVALVSIIGAGLSLFLYYRYNKEVQAYVIFTTAIAYVLWGILHHKLVHYLTIEIIFEYVLVAAIGSLVVLSLI